MLKINIEDVGDQPKLVENFGYPIWDKVTLINDINSQGNKMALIPVAKPDSKYTQAVILVVVNSDGSMEKHSIVPRIQYPQLTKDIATAKTVFSAQLLTKFDVEIFNRVDQFYSFLASLTLDKEISERCTPETYEVTLYYQELAMIDNGSDGGWYWGYETRTRTYYITVLCEEILGWGFDYYSTWNQTGGPGSGGSTYISELEQKNADDYHDIQLLYNPDYVHLNLNYENCGGYFGPGAKDMVSEMFRTIFQNSPPSNPGNLSEDQIVDILKNGLSNDVTAYNSDLKTCIEASIELLAANGVYFSLTGTLKTIADNAHFFKDEFENLCLMSDVSDADKAYLDYKKEAQNDLIEFLEDCTFEDEQDNTAFINWFIGYAKTFTITAYPDIDLCNLKSITDAGISINEIISFFTSLNLTSNQIAWLINHPQQQQSIYSFSESADQSTELQDFLYALIHLATESDWNDLSEEEIDYLYENRDFFELSEVPPLNPISVARPICQNILTFGNRMNNAVTPNTPYTAMFLANMSINYNVPGWPLLTVTNAAMRIEIQANSGFNGCLPSSPVYAANAINQAIVQVQQSLLTVAPGTTQQVRETMASIGLLRFANRYLSDSEGPLKLCNSKYTANITNDGQLFNNYDGVPVVNCDVVMGQPNGCP